MNKFLKLDVRKNLVIITILDKFPFTNFSLRIKFHKEQSTIAFVRVYCLEVVYSQTLQVQCLP